MLYKLQKRPLPVCILLGALLLIALILIRIFAPSDEAEPKVNSETGLLTEHSLTVLESAYFQEMTAALDRLGLSKADVKQRPYAKSMWRLPQKVVVAGEKCNPYLVFYTLDDGREMLYSYTYQYLGHSGEGGPYEEIEPLLNVLLPSAVALYGEPVVSSDPEYTLMDEQEREKMRQPDFVGFRYAEWHIGEKTKLTISAGGFYEGELTVHVDYTLENHLEQVASENAKIQEA